MSTSKNSPYLGKWLSHGFNIMKHMNDLSNLIVRTGGLDRGEKFDQTEAAEINRIMHKESFEDFVARFKVKGLKKFLAAFHRTLATKKTQRHTQ